MIRVVGNQYIQRIRIILWNLVCTEVGIRIECAVGV